MFDWLRRLRVRRALSKAEGARQRGERVAARAGFERAFALAARARRPALLFQAVPRAREAATCVGVLLAEEGRYPQALGWLEKALRWPVASDATLFHHGWVACRLGRLEAAIGSWQALSRRRPEDRRLALALARLCQRRASELVARGELAAAIPWLEHYCQDREADLPAREALAELHFRVAAGGLAGEKRDFEAAEAHLRRGQELAPAAPRWPLVLGALLALEGRNEEAGSVLGEAVALAPDRPEPRLLATLVAARLADRVAFEAGLEAFRRRWPAHPGGRRLEAARVALAFARGAWSDAADLMLEDDPAESRWQELLPACLYRAGRDAELERLSGPALGPAFWQAASLARRGLFFEAEARLRALRLAHSGSAEPGRALARLCRREALELARRGDREACAEALVEARSLAFVAPLPEAPLPEAPLPEASLPEAPWEPHLAGLLLVLAGRREQGLAVLEQGWRGAPGDGTLLHTLAVASYHGACLASRQPAMPPEALSEAWERTVATWVALLHLEDFQAEWVGGALARYRLEAPGPTSNFSRSLVTTLPGLLERAMEGSEAPILPRWQLARELRAASLLAAAGGFTPGGVEAGQGARGQAVGPLALARLGHSEAFGAFLLAVPLTPAPQPRLLELLTRLLGQDAKGPSEPAGLTVESRERLARHFSELGLAETLLELGRPQDARSALETLGCPACRRPQRVPSGAAPIALPRPCQPSCPGFAQRNPGYAGSSQAARALPTEACGLATRILLEEARAHLAEARPDLPSAVEAWRQALELARPAGQGEALEQQLAEMALGRGQALAQGGRLDTAVEVVDAACALCRGEARRQLAGRLAELLTDRGVEAGNAVPPRWADATADLRRAVAANPHSPRALLNLALALQGFAQELEGSRPERALGLLEEAEGALFEGVARIPGRPDLAREAQQLRQNRLAAINRQAVALANAERFREALALIDGGLALAPDHPLLAQNRTAIAAAGALRERLRELGLNPQLLREVEAAMGKAAGTTARGSAPARNRGGKGDARV